jgi:3-methyladenine DNA glycosylase/8-oxoguanine DNA glycosylase
MPSMSMQTYAERRGLSEAAIEKAIYQGWLKMTPSGRINVEAADRAWARYRARPLKFRFPPKPAGLAELNERYLAKAQVIHERMLSIPERLGPIVAAESSVSKIRRLLDQEVQEALIDLSDAMGP